VATPRKTAATAKAAEKAAAKAAPAKRAPRTRAPRKAAAALAVAAGDEADLGIVVDETANVPELADAAVPASLSFNTPEDPEAEARRNDPGTPFDLDGERFLAFEPKKAVRAMLFSAAAQGASDADRIHAVLTWCDASLSPLANMRIKARLLDRTDSLSVDHLVDIMNGLTDYWDARKSRAGRRAADKQPAPVMAGGRRPRR
jgi:hypothetical protein